MNLLDLLLAKYEADRAHELELEKIAGQYEMAAIQAVVVLNGVAATAFVSFAGGQNQAAVTTVARYAFLAWCLGLGMGLIAGFVGYAAQGQFTRAARHQRHAASLALGGADAGRALRIKPGEMVESLTKIADEAQEKGDQLWRVVVGFGVSGAALLIVGLAIASIALSTRQQAGPPFKPPPPSSRPSPRSEVSRPARAVAAGPPQARAPLSTPPGLPRG